MASIRKEYVVTVHPGGTWFVRYAYDDRTYDVANGHENSMGQGESAARLAIIEDQERRARIAEQQRAVKEFTVRV